MGGFGVVSEVGPTVRQVPHLYNPRPAASVLRDRTWHPCTVRMQHDDGRLNIQVEIDGHQYLENVPADTVVLW